MKYECNVQDLKKWGEHKGKQMKFPKYFKCGCDEGYCSHHVSPFLKAQEGKPNECKVHALS